MPLDLLEEVVKKFPASNATESAIAAMQESVRTTSVQGSVDLTPILSMLREILDEVKQSEAPVRTVSVHKKEEPTPVRQIESKVSDSITIPVEDLSDIEDMEDFTKGVFKRLNSTGVTLPDSIKQPEAYYNDDPHDDSETV